MRRTVLSCSFSGNIIGKKVCSVHHYLFEHRWDLWDLGGAARVWRFRLAFLFLLHILNSESMNALYTYYRNVINREGKCIWRNSRIQIINGVVSFRSQCLESSMGRPGKKWVLNADYFIFIRARELMCHTSSNLPGMVNKWRDVLSKFWKTTRGLRQLAGIWRHQPCVYD